MVSDPPEPVTLANFLAWERRQEQRYEFDGTQVIAMADVTVGHDTIGGSLRNLLWSRLRGGPCRALGPTLKVELAGRIRYPDAFVFCGYLAGSVEVVTDPVIVFEILSEDMPSGERAARRRDYQASVSVRRYIVLEREEIAATEFALEKGLWTARTLRTGDVLSMPEIGIAISLAEIYADADWLTPEAVAKRAIGGAMERLLTLGKARGYLTYDELNAALPQEQTSSEQIEDALAMLSEVGVNIVEVDPDFA